DLADVAGMKPSVGIDGLARRIIIVPVALHDVRSPAENLPILGDLHLDAGNRFAYRSDTAMGRGVDGDDRRSLRQAVAFVDLKAGTDEKCSQFGRERRS